MSKDLKNCRIDDNGNITMKMVKMGMDIDETRNHRILIDIGTSCLYVEKTLKNIQDIFT